MTQSHPDIIDILVDIAPGSRLDTIRSGRQVARDNAQKSYEALFLPLDPAGVTLAERFALAFFVAGLHGNGAITAFYRSQLQAHADNGLIAVIEAEIAAGSTHGPYGNYPQGPLSTEDKAGLHFAADPAHAGALGRLAAGLAHAHLLVFRPRDASPEALQGLLDAGWSTSDIVTLSQLVAFLSFQIRVVAGLRALADASQASIAAE